jgi:hypothetical protein
VGGDANVADAARISRIEFHKSQMFDVNVLLPGRI